EQPDGGAEHHVLKLPHERLEPIRVGHAGGITHQRSCTGPTRTYEECCRTWRDTRARLDDARQTSVPVRRWGQTGVKPGSDHSATGPRESRRADRATT